MLMFEIGIFSPIMINCTLSYSIILKILYFWDSLDVTQDRFFYIWVIEKLLFEFSFVFNWDQSWPWLRSSPIIRLCYNKSTNYLASTVILVKLFRVFYILHVWDNRLRVKAVFFCSSELFLRELLTLYLSWLSLSKKR